MESQASLVKANRHIFTTTQRDELCDFLESKNFRLEQAPHPGEPLKAEISGVHLAGLYVGRVRYGAGLTLRAVGRDEFWLQMPMRGGFLVDKGTKTTICDTRRGVFASMRGDGFHSVAPSADYVGLTLCVFKRHMIACLEAMLGEPLKQPLIFSSELDLSRGVGRTLAQHAFLAWRDLECEGGSWSEATMHAFQNFVMTSLLSAQPHSYSEFLARPTSAPAPRDVKRAIDFMHANLGAPIAMTDIVAATGVPGRTLFKHFRDAKGVSPMQYLRNARYEQVREMLITGDDEASVTAIAMAAGFTHMGRFAQDYRDRYGETPSQTLKQRRLTVPTRLV